MLFRDIEALSPTGYHGYAVYKTRRYATQGEGFLYSPFPFAFEPFFEMKALLLLSFVVGRGFISRRTVKFIFVCNGGSKPPPYDNLDRQNLFYGIHPLGRLFRDIEALSPTGYHGYAVYKTRRYAIQGEGFLYSPFPFAFEPFFEMKALLLLSFVVGRGFISRRTVKFIFVCNGGSKPPPYDNLDRQNLFYGIHPLGRLSKRDVEGAVPYGINNLVFYCDSQAFFKKRILVFTP